MPKCFTNRLRACIATRKRASCTNNLAWLLSTSAAEQLRDGQRAVAVAEQVCRGQQPPTAGALDTLAAAYAEQSRFEEAIEAASNALERASGTDMAGEIQARLELYRKQQPYREALK